jgi:hypothetical protein
MAGLVSFDMVNMASVSIYMFIIISGVLHAAALTILTGIYYGSAMRFFDFRILDRHRFAQIAVLTFTLANIPLGLISLLFYLFPLMFVFAPIIAFLCYTLTAAAGVYYLTLRFRMTGDKRRAFTSLLAPFFVYYAVMFVFGGIGLG